jgi:large subunit ribosomal protein L25
MITLSSTINLRLMKTVEIKGSLRTELGKKSSKQIRKAEGVPCVIYGKETNIHFQAQELAFKNLVYTHEAHLVNLNLDGKLFKVVLKDMQFHPVSDRIIHADFVEIFDDKPVVISVPVKVHGDSVGVIAGGKLSIKKRTLKVKALPKDLPEFVPVDITELKIHEGIRVGDISMDKVEFLDIKKAMVLTIATSRVAAKSEEEVAAEAATEAANAAAAPAAPDAE